MLKKPSADLLWLDRLLLSCFPFYSFALLTRRRRPPGQSGEYTRFISVFV